MRYHLALDGLRGGKEEDVYNGSALTVKYIQW
jgi:hypothetical protein